MKIIMTGGHISPLLAVLSALPKNVSVLVLGRHRALEGDNSLSLEYQTLKEKNIPFASINTGRLQRKITRHTFFSLFKFPFGLMQSLFIIAKFRPNVVLSFGGYVSLPVVISSWILGIPVIIHEQTLKAGLANKIASKFAKRICVSWEPSAKYFPKSKVIVTGNPVRKFSVSSFPLSISKENLPLIYVTGGSSGSHAINVLIEKSLGKMLEKYRIIHQTGDAREFKDFERLEEYKKTLPQNIQERYFLEKFVKPQEVGSILNLADLVISRSGMNTISELIYFNKPSLLIPLPYSQGGEQVENAKFLKSLGLSEIAFQKDLTFEKLLEIVDSMIFKIKDYKLSSEKNIIKNNAAEKIVEICLRES